MVGEGLRQVCLVTVASQAQRIMLSAIMVAFLAVAFSILVVSASRAVPWP